MVARELVRLSYVKVSEFQRRGAVHFHVLLRLDGVGDEPPAPPEPFDAQLLADAVVAALPKATVPAEASDADPYDWGRQCDVRVLDFGGHRQEAARVAGYIAKYATKSTEEAGGVRYRIERAHELRNLRCRDHARQLITSAWQAGEREEVDRERLRRWAHQFGYGGHCFTKRRRFSTTFKALREARAAYAAGGVDAAAKSDHQLGAHHGLGLCRERISALRGRTPGVVQPRSSSREAPSGARGGMKFSRAIDLYIADMRSEGRINSAASERGYRGTLGHHCDDIKNRDPSYVGREDVKRTLRRWTHPNTQRKNRAVLVSFYDWAMEEGYRNDNPACQTRRPKSKPPKVYRLTRAEAAAFLSAAQTVRERRIAHLGICAGVRNGELRGLQGRHFERDGWLWISADIAKGGRERWVPVLPELVPIAREIRANLAPDDYVLPAQRWRDPGSNLNRGDLAKRPSSSQALRSSVMRLAKRAGIRAHVHPHVMRHAFGDYVTRHAGIKNAQALLGHADVGTTQIYTGAPTLDELAAAVEGVRFAQGNEQTFYLSDEDPAIPLEAPTGIEPVYTALQAAA